LVHQIAPLSGVESQSDLRDRPGAEPVAGEGPKRTGRLIAKHASPAAHQAGSGDRGTGRIRQQL
jgi:hypothetical protein